MHIQFAAKEHSEQVIELWRQCFGDSSKFVSFYLSHHPFEEKTMLLTLEGDVVTSMLSLLPAQLVIGQKKAARALCIRRRNRYSISRPGAEYSAVGCICVIVPSQR